MNIRPGLKPTRTPYLEDKDRPPQESDPEIDAERKATYKTCVGTLIYISCDRMDLQGPIGELASHLSCPREYDWRALVKVAKYGASTATFGNWLAKPERSTPGIIRLENIVDTDHAKDKITRRSVTCGQILADGCPLASIVRKQTIQSLSSGESEFCGMHSIHVESVGIKRLFEWLGFKIYWLTRSDSSAARSMALREGVGRVRHLDSRLLYTQFLVRTENLMIQRIGGEVNPADIGTKRHTTEKFERLRELRKITEEPNDQVEDIEVRAVHSSVAADDRFARLAHDLGVALLTFTKGSSSTDQLGNTPD